MTIVEAKLHIQMSSSLVPCVKKDCCKNSSKFLKALQSGAILQELNASATESCEVSAL